ncbi:hypothetical protein HispidOSU_022579 [Sigmodon hispidus]
MVLQRTSSQSSRARSFLEAKELNTAEMGILTQASPKSRPRQVAAVSFLHLATQEVKSVPGIQLRAGLGFSRNRLLKEPYHVCATRTWTPPSPVQAIESG